MSKSVIPLSTPIMAHGQELTELHLRKPVGEDIIACGYPLQIGEGVATPLAGACAKYIARLAGIPPSAVKSMAAEDFGTAIGVIVGFFGSEAEEKPMTAQGMIGT
jgi:hypothetical protein